jgi:ornithine cyclodeaminase
MSVRILREPEIRTLLDLDETIEAVAQAYAACAEGRVILPDVVNLDLDDFRGEVHVKSAYIRGRPHYVIKIASGFYDNPGLGLPTGNGMMIVFEARTGRLEGLLLDNGYITEVRTGAAGAVAARYLAKKDLRKVGIIGAGSQARHQLRALMRVRRPEEVWVWSLDESFVRPYIREMSAAFPLRFQKASGPREAVEGADLVITVTPSRSPIVRASWLRPGVHITAVGSDGPDKQELEARALGQADLLYCDSISQCRRLGEVHHGLEEMAITEADISGELGELVLGRKPGRTRDDQITVADLTGLGAQDAAAAGLVFDKAVAGGLGDIVEL